MDMKVLLTGANGFVGANLVRKIIEVTGWDLECLVRDSSDRIPDHVNTSHHNLKNELDFDEKFDLIIHAAGNPSSKSCIENPASAVSDNITSTFNVLEFARRSGTKKFVFFSTCEVYKNRSGDATEDDSTCSHNMYAATKLACEHMCEAYAHTYGIQVIVFRLLNTWGPHCQPDRFPSIVARRFAQETRPHFFLDTRSTKRWLSVEEMATRVIKTVNLWTESPFEIYNLVGDDDLSLDQFISKFGSNFTFEYTERVHEKGYIPAMNALGLKLKDLLSKSSNEAIAADFHH
jgi:nucleoside-diphosphate-sugar epimerase